MNKKSSPQLQSTKQFMRNFLRINSSREFLVFLFFLFIAFVFWYMMTMTGDYEMKFSPKLKLKHVPSNVVVIEPLPERIDVVLRDKGDKLVEYKARRMFKELEVDYRQHANVKGHTAIYGNELIRLISSQLASSSSVVSVSVDTLQYYVGASRGVRVPVKLSGRIETAAHYGIDRIRVQPDSVTVYGTPTYIDTLTAIYTNDVHYVGLVDSVRGKVPLQVQRRGVRVLPSEVELSVAVTPYITKSVEVPITGYMFPYGMGIKTFPSKAKVSFRVSLEDYARVTEADFALQVHYEQVKDEASGRVAPRVETKADGVYEIVIEPSEVDYLIEVDALSGSEL